jgi:hypothetical protein
MPPAPRCKRAGLWTAEEGDGPFVPTLPALAAIRALAEGRLARGPGAGPCVGVLNLDGIAAEFAPWRIVARSEVVRLPPLFRRIVGEANFARLPAPIRRMHSPGWVLRARGEAEVDGPEGLLATLANQLLGFPRRQGSMPVHIEMTRTETGERWMRDYGGHRFASRLSPGDAEGRAAERFGPFCFDLALPCDEAGLRMEVRGWSVLGLRLPASLVPVSDARESVDAEGRFRFDVEVRLPLGLGRVFRYRGWLVPEG